MGISSKMANLQLSLFWLAMLVLNNNIFESYTFGAMKCGGTFQIGGAVQYTSTEGGSVKKYDARCVLKMDTENKKGDFRCARNECGTYGLTPDVLNSARAVCDDSENCSLKFAGIALSVQVVDVFTEGRLSCLSKEQAAHGQCFTNKNTIEVIPCRRNENNVCVSRGYDETSGTTYDIEVNDQAGCKKTPEQQRLELTTSIANTADHVTQTWSGFLEMASSSSLLGLFK